MRKIIITSYILLISSIIKAQENTPYAAISFMPQAAFTKSIRVDFEYSYNNVNWINIAPRFYFIENIDDDASGLYKNYKSAVGYGGNIYHKWYNQSEKDLPHLYLALGSGFHHFNIEYTDDGLHYEDDGFGNSIIVDEPYIVKRKIDQLNFELNIGVSLYESRFLVDLFVGTGFKYSFFKDGSKEVSHSKIPSEIRDGFLNFGYSGFYPIAGVKFGIVFDKPDNEQY